MALDDFDSVVDAFDDAGVEQVPAVREDSGQISSGWPSELR